MSTRAVNVPDDVLGRLHPTAVGKPVLIVNVASKCGFTRQYTALEGLYQRFGGQGLAVIGIPCNQFGGQEPGSDAEIQEHCRLDWGVTFPVLPRADVNGEKRLAIYEHLAMASDDAGVSGDVRWNFEKFLLDRQGNVIGRFAPHIEPDDAGLIAAVTEVLQPGIDAHG